MNNKTIAVGSQNPVKIKAAQAGFEQAFPKLNFKANGSNVESGVSDQPMSSSETLQGAFNRANRLQEKHPEADFWVGIEGGIEVISDQLFASAWVVVTDGVTLGQAKSGLFPLPPKIKQLVDQGIELGLANDRVFATQNSKQSGGAIGSLTQGLVSRQQLYHHAMLLALIPLLNRDLFGGELSGTSAFALQKLFDT